MKKVIAIACFAAFTTAGIASSISTFTINSSASVFSDKDKDKGKGKNTKAKKSCCSKNSAEAKSCHEPEKSTSGKVSSGANVTPAGTSSTQVKSCCKKENTSKSSAAPSGKK